MTSSRQLIAMIRSHSEGDSEQFLSIAEHIAAEAGRTGKTKVAEDIKASVARARRAQHCGSPPAPIPISAPRGELAGLVRASYPEVHLSDLVLGADLQRRVQRAVREHESSGILFEKGLAPRRKFLFSGPPGTGKSMTASAIAGEIGLPLFSVLLDGVITKYMGETASKLRLIFDSMHSARGVYFFDEVDALASKRGAENDIGEARRVLNSFLQFLEEDRSRSILIAATNHRSLLDHAIFRRFDAAFVYSKPSEEEAQRVLRKHLISFDVEGLDWAAIIGLTTGLSQADLAAAAGDAARDAVLDHSSELSTALVTLALRDRATIHQD